MKKRFCDFCDDEIPINTSFISCDLWDKKITKKVADMCLACFSSHNRNFRNKEINIHNQPLKGGTK